MWNDAETARLRTVVLAPYSLEWARQFAQVAATVAHAFAPAAVAIEHVGSTAVPGLDAKPVIDVLLGADSLATIERRVAQLALFGFDYLRDHEIEQPHRRYFVRRSLSAMHVDLHGVVWGSRSWHEHLTFRDALRADAALLARYQALKQRLTIDFAGDCCAYTSAKLTFIRSVLDAACTHCGAPRQDC